jgi:hypothetical protein
MSGYAYLDRSSTRSVHFEFRNFDAEDQKSLDEYALDGGTVCILDYPDSDQEEFFLQISRCLKFDEGETNTTSVVELSDSLTTLSETSAALAIVVRGAGKGFSNLDFRLFKLVDAHLIQLHHWLDQEKPCNLIFHI